LPSLPPVHRLCADVKYRGYGQELLANVKHAKKRELEKRVERYKFTPDKRRASRKSGTERIGVESWNGR